jgi:hypothetical protein
LERLSNGRIHLDDAEWQVVKAFARPWIGQATTALELNECLVDARSRLSPELRVDHAIALGLLEQFVSEANESVLSGTC